LRRCSEAPADLNYGVLRARLEGLGRRIGGNDLLIAAQATALGYVIVTDNEREFAQIADLPREKLAALGRAGRIRPRYNATVRPDGAQSAPKGAAAIEVQPVPVHGEQREPGVVGLGDGPPP
jgi:hypothetical protein